MNAEISSLLREFLSKACLDYNSIEKDEESESILRYNVDCADPQGFIGKHGDTLFAFQHVFRLIMQKMDAENKPDVVIDFNNYRTNQEMNAIYIAKEKIQQLKKYGGNMSLPPMSSYRRRAVHMYILNNHPEIHTESVGLGTERRITMKLKD